MKACNLSVNQAMVVHALYEIVDNMILMGRCTQQFGIKDCKYEPDTRVNSTMDQLCCLVGFQCAEKVGVPELPVSVILLSGMCSGHGSALVFNASGNDAYKESTWVYILFLLAYVFAFF